MSTMTKDLYDLGRGTAHRRRAAEDARDDRAPRELRRPPEQAFRPEVVPTPEIGPREALVYVMAAGINYNNVWAALGIPIDVIKAHAQMGDDDAASTSAAATRSGIVYAVGDEVDEREGRRRGRRSTAAPGTRRRRT